MSADVVVIITPSGGVWFDGVTLIEYLRSREKQVTSLANHPATGRAEALSALSMGDAIRQIADGLALSTMEALDKSSTPNPG
jgi:hypothetical protein